MDFFIEVEKDGLRLIIHPSTKRAHMDKGWRVVRDTKDVALEAKEKPKTEPEQPKTVQSKAKK